MEHATVRGHPGLPVALVPAQWHLRPGRQQRKTPADLAGKTVGVAEYQLTANVWIRGILQDRYGLPVTAVRYRTGGLHEPGRPEKLAIALPEDVDIAPIGPGDTLSEMLAEGRIDALYTPRTPRSFVDGRARRLFTDFKAEEHTYWEATRIFPVMHVVVMRTEVYERDRWIARSLFDAFEKARRLAYDGMGETAALRYMLPWLAADLEHAQRTLGPDYWTYGLAGNETALDTIRTALRVRAGPHPASATRLGGFSGPGGPSSATVAGRASWWQPGVQWRPSAGRPGTSGRSSSRIRRRPASTRARSRRAAPRPAHPGGRPRMSAWTVSLPTSMVAVPEPDSRLATHCGSSGAPPMLAHTT